MALTVTQRQAALVKLRREAKMARLCLWLDADNVQRLDALVGSYGQSKGEVVNRAIRETFERFCKVGGEG